MPQSVDRHVIGVKRGNSVCPKKNRFFNTYGISNALFNWQKNNRINIQFVNNEV